MTQLDVSAFEYFLPILSFLVVFFVSFFAISKSKIIENKFTESLLSFIIAIVFVAVTPLRNFVLTIIPWFAVVLVGAFLIFTLGGFLGKDALPKGAGKAFVWILAVVFIVTAFFVFSYYIIPYLPGYTGLSGNPGNPVVLRGLSLLYSPKVAGALLVLGIGALVSWIVVKAK